MAFKRKKEEVEGKRRWTTFVQAHTEIIHQTGLPEVVFESEGHWLDFLDHGCLDHHEDATRATVDALTETGYQGFKELVDAYFREGYPGIHVMALRPDDRREIERRYPPG